jgi:DNA-binding NtrC family response regulator
VKSPSVNSHMSALAFLYDHIRDFPTWFRKLTPSQLEDVATAMVQWRLPPEEQSILPAESIERREFLRAVALCNGNVEKAARALSVGKTTLYRKLKSWGYTVQNRALLAQAAALSGEARTSREHIW